MFFKGNTSSIGPSVVKKTTSLSSKDTNCLPCDEIRQKKSSSHLYANLTNSFSIDSEVLMDENDWNNKLSEECDFGLDVDEMRQLDRQWYKSLF
jgi:hypothetical protein